MKQTTLLLILFTCTIYNTCLFAQKTATSKPFYEYKKGDVNGIGKWYLGREIAYVMGFQGINWLERSSREKEESTGTLIKNMNIQSTDCIADIGAGSGYHVFKMAPLVNKGKMFAVDIQIEMLNAINNNKKFDDYKNITLVKGAEKSTNLKENAVDKILMVDVYHEFSFPREMLSSIYTALKKDGELFLIEYRLEDASVPIKKIHKMTQKQAVKEFKAAGFKLKKNLTNLPWQHCMVFIKE
ncbi:class I SAM-dependent methyltransferase [uncultured Polaribacter sp.]|uniref:class I SAM-dependent methyltransferase n=1 Tax=uncultured Polaribacter sp. TaxID=174711 RepID=UPI002618ADBB|nr:class I SAM-dependent methyltransferase [uncultured Polaribacter sp.]